MALTGECKAIRFMENNYIHADHTVLTASSSDSDYPLANLSNVSRTKVWKAAGNFEIHSGISKIYVDDGSAKIGTIASGQYSGTTLAASIATELNAVSSGWTVSYSTSTYKFTISHATATLEFSKQTDAIWDSIGYTGTVDLVLAGSGVDSDEIRIHNIEYINLDLGTSTFETTFMGLIPSVGVPLSISRNAVVTLQADNVPIVFGTTPALEVTAVRDDRGYFHFFDDTSDQFYRYRRIQIEDRTNGNGPGAVSGAYAYIGDHITFTGTNVAKGIRKELVDPSSIQTTDTGRRYFNTRDAYNKFTNLQVQLPARADRLTFEQFVHDHKLTEPFFISIDPGSKISDSLAELTLFCNFERLPNMAHRFLDLYDIANFSVREVV